VHGRGRRVGGLGPAAWSLVDEDGLVVVTTQGGLSKGRRGAPFIVVNSILGSCPAARGSQAAKWSFSFVSCPAAARSHGNAPDHYCVLLKGPSPLLSWGRCPLHLGRCPRSWDTTLVAWGRGPPCLGRCPSCMGRCMGRCPMPWIQLCITQSRGASGLSCLGRAPDQTRRRSCARRGSPSSPRL
jgi:hypothetical protein